MNVKLFEKYFAKFVNVIQIANIVFLKISRIIEC